MMAICWAAWCKIFLTSMLVCSCLPSASDLSLSSRLVSRCVRLCCGIECFWGREEDVGSAAVLPPCPRKFEF